MGAVTENEVEQIVNRTVLKTLTSLGVDMSTPEAVLAVQADFAHIRKQREGAEEIAKWIKRSFVTTLVGGGLWALWEGIKLAIRAKSG